MIVKDKTVLVTGANRGIGQALAAEALARGAAHVRRVADELGLTASQVIALRELSEPVTARELATRMGCEPPNATFVLDRLEQQGLIQRRPHPADRRAKQIVLTPDGQHRRATVLEHLSSQPPLGPLTSAEQETLRGLLKALSTES